MASSKQVASKTVRGASASHVGAESNFPSARVSFKELAKRDIELLRTLAALAETLASHHLTDENFKRLLSFAYGKRIITAEKLGEIGRVDRTTASRWINGLNAPNSLAQEAILAKIADEAKRQALQLEEHAS